MSNDTIICGDFNIDTIANSKDKYDYETLLLAFDFKRQNFEPTRITATSSTCLDHVITSYQVKTETIQTTMSDHFTVLGTIPGVFFNEPVISEEKIYRRDKGDKALNFLFLLDQKLKKLDQLDKLDIEKSRKLSCSAWTNLHLKKKPPKLKNAMNGSPIKSKMKLLRETNYFVNGLFHQLMTIRKV